MIVMSLSRRARARAGGRVEDTGHGLDGALLLGAVVDGGQPGQHALQEEVHGLQRGRPAQHGHAARGHVPHRRVRVLQAAEQVRQVLQQLEGTGDRPR